LALIDKAEVETIRIVRYVLHEVGPNPGDEVISENELRAGLLAHFLIGRIVAASRGSTFVFTEPADGRDGSPILASLRTVANDGGTFVERGQALARAFQQVQDARTKRGLFALFELIVGEKQHFAIVKFDHQISASYLADLESHTSSLSLNESSITSSPEAIQKAAVIRLEGLGGLLSVRERGVIRARGATDLFENYLGVVRRYSPTQQTARLVEVIEAVAVEHQGLLPKNFLTSLSSKTFHLMQVLESFDPDDNSVVSTIFGATAEDSPLGASFERLVSKDPMLDGEHFEIDKTAVREPTWTRIVTAEKIEIRYGNQFADRVVVSDDKKTITVTTAEITSNVQYSPKKTARRS